MGGTKEAGGYIPRESREGVGEGELAFAQTRSIDRWAPKWMEAYEEAASRSGKGKEGLEKQSLVR